MIIETRCILLDSTWIKDKIALSQIANKLLIWQFLQQKASLPVPPAPLLLLKELAPACKSKSAPIAACEACPGCFVATSDLKTYRKSVCVHIKMHIHVCRRNNVLSLDLEPQTQYSLCLQVSIMPSNQQSHFALSFSDLLHAPCSLVLHAPNLIVLTQAFSTSLKASSPFKSTRPIAFKGPVLKAIVQCINRKSRPCHLRSRSKPPLKW